MFVVFIMVEMMVLGEILDILFWVGCFGSFDDRVKKIMKVLVKILNYCQVKFVVFGVEELCIGDLVKCVGNEFMFQMQVMMNIQVLDGYEVKCIVIVCLYCFNIFWNEYFELGGNYEVVYYMQLIQDFINIGKLVLKGGGIYKGKCIIFYDLCYFGCGNDIYEVLCEFIEKLDVELVEMKCCKLKGFCCGVGGVQMFKEVEKGNKEVNVECMEDVLEVVLNVIVIGCFFCNIMMIDGVKNFNKEGEIVVLDVVELIVIVVEL